MRDTYDEPLTEMVPQLDPWTAKNAWKLALHCDHQVFDGTVVEQSKRLEKFYNFSDYLNQKVDEVAFIHGLSHVLIALAMDEIVSNPRYCAIPLPFEHAANGNYIAECLSDAITARLCVSDIDMDTDKAMYDVHIQKYQHLKYRDWQRTGAAVDAMDRDCVGDRISVFEISRETGFQLYSNGVEDEFQPFFTKWGEAVYPEMNQTDLQFLADQIFDIIDPVVMHVRRLMDTYMREHKEDDLALGTINDLVKPLTMPHLREMISNSSGTRHGPRPKIV